MLKLVMTLVVAVAFVAPAAADKQKAAMHLKQGAAYYKAEQYDEAIAEFKKAHELDKKPQTLFNIANAYYKKADYKSAIENFQAYLAADPNGKYAQQALEFTTIANKALAEQEAKRKADEQAAQQDAKKRAAVARLKQGDAYEQAGAWTNAGDEYRAATEIDGNPEHLLIAAEAYRKGSANDKARDAYRAYLQKVPLGGRSDEARTKLAELTRANEPSDRVETPVKEMPVNEEAEEGEAPKITKREGSPDKRRWWLVGIGGALLITGLLGDLIPAGASNGELQPEDFIPVGFYALGTTAVLGGVIRW